MEPIWGLILFLVMCSVVALIASKKGRSGTIFFLASSLPAIPLMLLVSMGSGGNGTMVAVAAFLCPVIGFVSAIMADNREQVAVKTGDFGDYRKCPFCAESVRKEAIKCKHCGSDLPAIPSHIGLPALPDVGQSQTGLCTKCDAEIPLDSRKCPKCNAVLSGIMGYRVRPITPA